MRNYNISMVFYFVIEVYQMQRRVYLCDSFQGLPPPRSGSLRPDETIYASKKFNASLAKGEDTVTRNFYRFGVSMEGVRMVPGYFVDSLPGLRAELKGRGERLALLRLDGDMYDSTIDITSFTIFTTWSRSEGSSSLTILAGARVSAPSADP